MMNNRIINHLTPDEALAILKHLAKGDADLAQRIEQIGRKRLTGVDIEDIADQVYSDLDALPVEEVWERAESSYGEYIEPGEAAWEMFEETLKPFMREMKRYQQLSMCPEAKHYCMGILQGIYRFEKESQSEYKNWAEDAPPQHFHSIIDNWKESTKDPTDITEVEEFVRRELSNW
jgi:hypothetical protein